MKKTSKNPLGDLFSNKKSQILSAWMKAQLNAEALREDLMSNDDLKKQSSVFLDAFITIVEQGDYLNQNTPAYNLILKMLTEVSKTRAQQGFTPRETGIFVFSLKEVLFKVLQDEFGEDSTKSILEISQLLDSFGIHVFESYILGREETIERQRRELVEISTPVIRVWNGVLALPIIGTLDSIRSQQIMEGLLEAIVQFGYDVAILDISGVPTIDTLTAQHIIKTVNAAKLMGAECIISGIRPEIAQTIVSLGIDLIGITQTKASMADAMKEAFKMLNLKVVSSVK